ncbi:hypothetical protein BP6252_03870 [Coleophoma cylindrospora]|uniref:Zn(2)-C6 fungal-type domain-containing protein n=1 Tax=Coleophoma cylindrospora TaxID=1849047 RepID=A0A3D8SAD5_9HELO|nr:hypothetical protein BP6252_03870 [Coleophoma cylindrospora]
MDHQADADAASKATYRQERIPIARKPDVAARRPIALPNINHPPHDRQRVRRACECCRKKKIKCNGEEPCQRCIDYGVHCEYADYVAPVKPGDNGNIEQLENRIASMESLFRQFLERFENGNLGLTLPSAAVATVNTAAAEPPPADSSEVPITLVGVESPGRDAAVDGQSLECDEAGEFDIRNNSGNDNYDLDNEEPESPSHSHCYADGFGELDADTTGQLRYVGLGSTASVVDTCVGLRRHIYEGLEKKGIENEETIFRSPQETVTEAAIPTAQDMLSREMPSRPLIRLLMDTFSADLYFLFPIIAKDDINTIYNTLQRDELVDTGVAAIFFAVLAISALLIPPNHEIFANIDARYQSMDCSASFYSTALWFSNSPQRNMARRNGKLQDNVVALGLLSMYLAAIGSQAEAWIMVGTAIRHGQDLGLHRSPERLQLPQKERSRRRYLWWCLYVLERQLSTALGRPLSIDDADCDVEIPCKETDPTHFEETAGFVSMIHLHKILGTILKTVNSVKNADSWREVTKYDELRKRIRDSNVALHTWAKEKVPQEIRTAQSGKNLIQKHVALSAFFCAVMLLHRIFMSNPHRPSPLADPQAQLQCAKAARDCIQGATDFLQCVPRSHFLVFHGQYVFVSAIVLLQCIRGSNDHQYIASDLCHVQSALDNLRALESSWIGAKKCRAIAEEYLEFTYHVLQAGRKGVCNFEHGTTRKSSSRRHSHTRPSTKRGLDYGESKSQSPSKSFKKRRFQNPRPHPSTETNIALGCQSSAELGESLSRSRSNNISGTPPRLRGILKKPQVHVPEPPEMDGSYFDNVIDNGLGPMLTPQGVSFLPEGFFPNADFAFGPSDLSMLLPDFRNTWDGNDVL